MELIKNTALWFGEYGGCFVADAFSMHCDTFYKQFESVVNDPTFEEEFQRVAHKYLGEFKRLNQNTVLVPENYYALVGTSLLCKRLNKTQALAACRFADEALLMAKLAKEFGYKLKMSLTKELSEIETVVSQLKLLGVQVETTKCRELINCPELYVFQEWLSGSKDKHIVNMRANTGAFPQPNIAAYFIKKYHDDFKAFLDKENMHFTKMAFPVVSGSFALGLMNSEDNTQYVGVECDVYPDLREEKDSFCGTFTKVVRNNYVDRVLCAELSDLYDRKAVERVNMNLENVKTEVMLQFKENLSLQSYAVLSLENFDGLRVVKEIKEGTNL